MRLEFCAAVTDKVNEVLFVTPAPEAVIVNGYTPAAVETELLTPTVNEQVGLQALEERDAIAPEGRPAIENATCCAAPELKVAVTVLLVEEPAVSDRLPEFVRAKSNG